MAALVRTLVVGYGTAAAMACVLVASGLGWIPAILTFWIGGAGLSLAVAALSVWLRPAAAHAGVATGDPDEFRRWDADAAAERFEADLRLDRMAAGQSGRTDQERKIAASE